MSRKRDLIEEILNIELEMFLNVRSLQKASCQEDPDSFRIVRMAQFLSWSEDTLDNYLNCLRLAIKEGRNLMTEKYARMEGLISRPNKNPLIEKILSVQYAWQKEMFEKYPNLMRGARPLASSDDSIYQTSFETYLRGELGTYSDETLESLHRDISEKLERGENMTEKVYEHTVRGLEYDSLEEAEQSAINRTQWSR